ncbi:MAG TPA: 5-oxoprolinase subunit PxpA [Xanthomonadaceae bacterium]|nr:5-oxoprolinase subunit PxpA [Xanthomonadaceae bacterium]
MREIDFNCDLGEGLDSDAAILPHVSSANIACGLHAGDAQCMQRTVALCLRHGVAIGAHPSLPDREGFGRRELATTPAAVHALTLYQVGALHGFVAAAGARLHHVKPHGALYNLAARDRAIAAAIASAVARFDAGLVLYALSGSELARAGQAEGLAVAHEVFAERRYEADGSLTPRSRPDAVIADIDMAAQQIAQMLQAGAVTARTGESVPVRADTVCLHGDRADAALFARRLRAAIEQAGYSVRALERGA